MNGRIRPATPFGILLCLVLAPLLGAGQVKPPKEPAKVHVEVSPGETVAGADVTVTLRLAPKPGIKINRYPKMTLTVPEQAGLTPGGRVATGNDRPPPPGDDESNYYKKVDPLKLALPLAQDARPGRHEIEGKLRYFYCVTESGFCAPARVAVKIPVAVSGSAAR